MGTQQMLLIVLGVILIGVAIAVGISMFGATNVGSNRDALIEGLQNLSVDASSFKTRPTTMGGGSGSYSGYSIPTKLQTTEDGSYASTVAAQSITLVATSGQGYGTVTAVVDSVGELGSFTYTGEFQ